MTKIFHDKTPRLTLSVVLTFVLLTTLGDQRPQAQSTPRNETESVELYQALLDLTNPWTVLCVAAHPDDEDGSTLTVMRRKYGAHTVSLFSTFGEGGQNAVGPELYEDLGVIRARETLAAAAVQGSEAHFLGMRDFGFSKSANETFRVWGETEALRRMVLQIRQIRPDVIITNHDTTSGHGHHQATGRLILKAFDAAADPKQFPEQLKQVSTWQAQRLFVRTRVDPGSDSSSEFLTIDPNEVDPIRSTSFAQEALNALQEHATQGPWPKTIAPGGARVVRYRLVREAKNAAPLSPNAKTPMDGLQLPDAIRTKLTGPTYENKPLAESFNNRGAVLVSLINARKRGLFSAASDGTQTDSHRFTMMSGRLDKAIALAAGASVSLNSESVLIPGMKEKMGAAVTNSGDAEIQIKQLEVVLNGKPSSLEAAEKLLPGTDTAADTEMTVPANEGFSVPSAEHLYDGKLFGDRVVARAQLEIEGAPFTVVSSRSLDVAPEIEIVNISPTLYVQTPGTLQQKPQFAVKLKNNLSTQFTGSLRVVGPDLETGRDITLTGHRDETVELNARNALPINMRNHAKMEVAISVNRANKKGVVTTRRVPTFFVDAKVVPNLRVAYLPSFDESLQKSLAALGVDAHKLTVEEIQSGALESFSTVVIDNRGYEAHPELIAANSKLLNYVNNGGTLIVCYHKTGEWNPDSRRPQLAPYPIILSDDRVTEEDAPVTFLQPTHPLLNVPNKIGSADFDNWIQERGLYFPRDWDSHYTALLSTNDKGETPLKGGLLVAPYGKGNYIYTSYVWYRQLRGGIPGGYRFFANMISYPRRISVAFNARPFK